MIGKPSTNITGWPRFIILAVGGLLVGLIIEQNGPLALSFRYQTINYPAAYQLPKLPGGTSLRMAMLHDVLLERYLHHGTAWYEKSNAQSTAQIAAETAKPGPPSPQLLDAMDELAVGLENLHQSDAAAAVMVDKLKLLPEITIQYPTANQPEAHDYNSQIKEATRQIRVSKSLSPIMHQQYTARANLGTSLIHAAFPKLFAGDPAARVQMQKGLAFIRASIAINPNAHFGRETWQAIVVQHFLAAQEHPELLTHFDMIGNDLSQVHPRTHRRSWVYGLQSPASWLDAHISIEERIDRRSLIQRLGVAPEWANMVKPGMYTDVPFDEPALALMGMWMLGGGPSPHSSMALANIAMQIGQLEIAWEGYERALSMADRFSPDPIVRDALVAYCQKQQTTIASTEEPHAPEAWTSKTRQRYTAELAWALQYRSDYHAFEAQQIAAGIPLDDPAFYTPFFKTHPSIASPVGQADEIAVRIFSPDGPLDALPAGLLLAGIFTLLAALTTKPKTHLPKS